MTGERPPRAGFTMVELMVVMAVIGLLLSIAVPHYLDALERGRAPSGSVQHNPSYMVQSGMPLMECRSSRMARRASSASAPHS